MFEENSVPAATMYNTFLAQAKPDVLKNYMEIFDELKAVSQPKVPGEGAPLLPPEQKVEGDGNVVKIPIIAATLTKAKNCTQIFAEYLNEMAHKVSEKFFTTLIIFIRLYRDYMNMHGWDILAKYRPVSAEDRKKMFTSVQDAEHLPEGCNDFVRNFLPKEFPNFDQMICVDMTLHLCKWLYQKGYTHTSISPL